MSKRTAIVTGGAGFVGSHVVDALLAEGWTVLVLDDLSTGAADRVASEAALEMADITDGAAVARAFDAAAPQAVFHLAAQSSVTRSVRDPGLDCDVNVRGTLNVLEAAGAHGAAVVFTSTGGALYGDDAVLPTPEDSVPAPVSPYGASKWAGEAYVLTWRRVSRLPHCVCRLANVYGPRQSPHGEAGVVAIVAGQLLRQEAPILYGFGRPTRDYVHVQDVARALVAAVGSGDVFNVSTGVETSVLEIFEALQDAAGTSFRPQLAPLRPGELMRSCMDPIRVQQRLGWNAEIMIEDGLRTTFEALQADARRASGDG